MRQLESAEQQKLFTWWHMEHRRLGVPEQLLFAIPNGGKRDLRTAVRMKREGVQAGIPDMMLAVPRRAFHGLFIELKQGKGRLSDHQAQALALLQEQGYATAVPYGFQEARAAIEAYLAGRHEDTAHTAPGGTTHV